MKPQEVYKELKLNNFPMLIRGDIVITNNLSSKFASLIRFRSKLKGKKAFCNHEEIYLLNGKCIGANRRVNIGDLSRFFKGNHEVYIFRDKLLTLEEKNTLILEAIKWYGRPYDALGIVWQGLDAITFSTFFSRIFNKKILAYCSELVQRVYWETVQRNPSLSPIGAGSPNDSFLYKTFSEDFECVFMLTKNKLGKLERTI